MRLDINLASQPYEDARQFWMRWGLGVGVVGLLTLILLTLTVTGWFNARRDHKAIAEKKALIAERDRLRAHAEEFLNRPENRSTRDESQFLNDLIERKAFSWTRVLESLEKVMPARVHLVNISPGLDEDNQLMLKMTVAGDSREKALELARRMEESKRFAQTIITGEVNRAGQNGDTEQFDMLAVYIPEPANAQDTKPETPASAKKPEKDASPKNGAAGAMTGTSHPVQPRGAGARPNVATARGQH